MSARRRSSAGGGGKIEELRGETRADLGKAAACILAALGNDTHETEPEHIRAMTGAVLMAEGLHTLKQIQRLLTPKES